MDRFSVTRRYPLAVALLMSCAGIFSASAAEPGDNIEGTWRIRAPLASLVPMSGQIPFTSTGKERYERNRMLQAKQQYADYDLTLARCSSPGLPRIMLTPTRFRIWQRPHVITLSYEWNQLFRQIDMGGGLPPVMGAALGGDDDLVGRAIGTGKGHWEGKTLVISTDNFVDYTLLDNLIPHGYQLKITEHIHRTGANTLQDRITIEDPETFTQSWDAIVSYQRQPDDAFPEDVCLDRLDAGSLPLPPQ